MISYSSESSKAITEGSKELKDKGSHMFKVISERLASNIEFILCQLN